MKKVASLQYGVIFKKAFCDPEIFMGFVKDITGVEIEVDHVETEKGFTPTIGYVAPRYDLYAEDKKNRIIIDIQHVRYPDHYHRFLYYHCVAMLQQVKNSYDYRTALRVLTLVVLTSGDKHKFDVATTEFDPRTSDGTALGEINHKIFYLCPKYLSANTPEPYREWLRAINDSLDGEVEEADYQNELIQKVFAHIEENLVSPEDQARIIEEALQQGKYDAGREEGRQIGRQEGLQEGREEGLQQGLQEGLQQGLQEGRQEGLQEGLQQGLQEGLQRGVEQERIEIARKMLASGMAIEMVAQFTGLSESLIQSLR